TRRAERRQQRRFARVGQSNQTCICDQPQLDTHPKALARRSGSRDARGAAGRSYEVHIALSAASALGDYTLLIGGDQIGEQTGRFFLEGERSRRDADNQVVAAMAILLFAA